jgi:hypothetical protein
VLDVHSVYRKKNKMKTLKTSTVGTYNVVSIIQINDKKKYAVRLSKNPVPMQPVNPVIIQSKINWHKANLLKICPNVIYNGYFRIGEGDSTQIHELLITEAYETDLHTYFATKRMTHKTVKMDKDDRTICEKLQRHLYTMASHAMWVACIDIKPANVVLNTDTMDVRMIDLDGDWCTVIPVQLQSVDTTINSYFEACMLMACHLLVIEYNIFADYMTAFDLNELRKALHDRLSGDHIHMVYWLQMVKHYFKNLKSDDKPQNDFDVKFWMENVVLWSRMRDTTTPQAITAVDPISCKYRDPEKKKCVTKAKFKNHIYDGKPIPKPKKIKPCMAGKERSCTTNRCKKIAKYPTQNVAMEMPPAPSPKPKPAQKQKTPSPKQKTPSPKQKTPSPPPPEPTEPEPTPKKKAPKRKSPDPKSPTFLDELDDEHFPILIWQNKSLQGLVNITENLIEKRRKIIPAYLFRDKNSADLLNNLFTHWTKKIGALEAIKKIDRAIRLFVEYTENFDDESLLAEETNYDDYYKPMTAANKRILYRVLSVEKAKLANIEKTQPPKKGKKVSFISPDK